LHPAVLDKCRNPAKAAQIAPATTAVLPRSSEFTRQDWRRLRQAELAADDEKGANPLTGWYI
jgi:hypothetical protein